MKIIIANLKMNMSFDKVRPYIEKVNKNIILCPSYIYIPYFLNNIVGAQDCYMFDEGSYTSYISPLHLSQMGVKYVILGHSERRNIDTNEIILEKIKVCLKNNLKVILCIGEAKDEDKILKIKTQLAILKDINLDNIIIAYEPIWAIGTGIIPTNEQIKETVNFIKNIYDVPVLYGGSVDLNNINELNKITNVDGYLIGKASVDYEKINEIYDICNQ